MEVQEMTASTSATGRQVEVNGASLHVEDQGTGDPILLVQPGLVSSAIYAGIIPLLTSHYRVITFDSRGHGQSTNPGGKLSYELIADDTAALIDALGLDRPVVGGWSDGGQVALEFGLRHPGRARGLIVGGASLEVAGEAAKAQMRAMMGIDENGKVDLDTFSNGIGAMMLPMMRQFHTRGEEHWQTVLQQSATMWMSYDGMSQEEVEQIATPCLIAVGDRDELITLDEVVKLYRWLPDAELAIMPGTAHMRALHDPALFAAAILDFLQRH
jgi:pimeloyl-ACP methyl ester carboxylesterase